MDILQFFLFLIGGVVFGIALGSYLENAHLGMMSMGGLAMVLSLCSALLEKG